MRLILTLLPISCLLVGPAFADTLNFFQNDQFTSTSHSRITDTERIISPGPGQVFATVMETSTPCATLISSGCLIANALASLPKVAIPTGQYVTSAILALSLTTSESPTQGPIYVTPINPGQPFRASTRGTIIASQSLLFNTAIGSYPVFVPGLPSSFPSQIFLDYTGPVQNALLQANGNLASVTVRDSISYFDEGGESIFDPGQNADTVYLTYFDQYPSVDVAAFLTVNTAEIPESGLWPFCLLCLLFVLYGSKVKRAFIRPMPED